MNSRPRPATPPPRALLVLLRGLGTGFLGPFGNEWVRTPTFDRLAARGVVYDRHYSLTTDPIRAHDALWSETPGLPLQLAAAGVATARVRSPGTTQPTGWVFDESVNSGSFV